MSMLTNVSKREPVQVKENKPGGNNYGIELGIMSKELS